MDVLGTTQRGMLRALLHNKEGLTVDRLTGALNVSRNAVRQHLAALERDGVVAKGPTRPSGGRPEQLYVITEQGQELFPRRYSWFSELLMDTLRATLGEDGAAARLAEMGRSVTTAPSLSVLPYAWPPAMPPPARKQLKALG